MDTISTSQCLKAAVLQVPPKKRQILKLTVKTGQVMFSGEIYYYWPLNSVDKSLANIVFHYIIYCLTIAVAVMYSRNIPMAEKRIVCFQSKKVKICSFFLFLTTIIYIWRGILKKIVTYDFLVYFGAQLL